MTDFLVSAHAMFRTPVEVLELTCDYGYVEPNLSVQCIAMYLRCERLVQLYKSFDPHNTRLSEDCGVIVQEHWYYLTEIVDDLRDVDLLSRVTEEIFATTWKYSRSVIPQYTIWTRYVPFIRIIIIGTIVEFSGELVNVVDINDVLGNDLQYVLDTLVEGTPGQYVAFSNRQSSVPAC
jgi:hypothetical protein